MVVRVARDQRLSSFERRVVARERLMQENCGTWWRVWRMNSVTAALNGVWGRVRSPMASRLPRVCRSAQDDLSGIFKNVIGAIIAAAMQKAVVCAV